MKDEFMNMENDIDERTFAFAVRIFKLCQSLEKGTNSSRVLADQLLRSGTSIGANAQEARAAQSKADFIAKMSISRKESRETLYWLKLLAATKLVPATLLTDITDEADQLVAILTAIVKTAQSNK